MVFTYCITQPTHELPTSPLTNSFLNMVWMLPWKVRSDADAATIRPVDASFIVTVARWRLGEVGDDSVGCD